jgi:hypothetical protein
MNLVNELIKGLLPEEDKQQTTALYAGGFKPPTSGHFEVVEQALKQNPEIDEFIIFVGAKERDGISQDESMLIWDIYKQYLPLKVKIEPTSIAPIKAVYDFAKNHPTREVLWVIGAREGNEEDFKDITSRTKSITNYPNIELRTIVTKGGVSGTAARNASKVSLEKFIDFIPSKLTDEEKQEVYNLVSNKIQESTIIKDENTLLYLNIPKFNSPKTIQQYLIENINEINLSKENAVDTNGDLTGGTFIVGDITYEYSIKNIPNPYKDLGLFYNVQFTPKGEVTSIPKGGKENYIKILSTMYKIIVDFIEKEKPDYIGISSLDGNKNYHTVYNRLTDNSSNLIPGYFRKNSNLIFNSPQGKGRFIVLKRKKNLNENASYSNHIDYKQKIKELTKHMLDKGMNIQPLPKVRFVHGDSSNASQFLGKTAYYDPNNQEIILYTEGRHPKDIVRSFSHEMIHHIQNLEDRLGNIQTTNTQEDDSLNDIEAEANLKGTMTFRNWTDSLNEEILIKEEDQLMAEVVNPDGERFEYKESNIKGLFTYKDSYNNLYFARIFYQQTSSPYFEFKVGWFEDNNLSKPKYEPQLPPNVTGMDNLKRRNTIAKIYRDEILPYFKSKSSLSNTLIILPISDLRYTFSKRLIQNYTPDQFEVQYDDKNQKFIKIVFKDVEESKSKDPFGINAYAMELARLREDEAQPWKIYLDMDGVLADFDQRFKDLSGMLPGEFEDKYGKNAFWDFIDEGDNKIKFWAGIPVMDGAKQLVDFAKDYDYELLTAPSNKKQSLIGKSVWVKKHTGDIFPTKPKVNFKKAKNKHLIKPELTKYDILVDDRVSTIDNWNNAGGTGILYKNINQTLSDLKKLGL